MKTRRTGLEELTRAARHQLLVEWNDTGVPRGPSTFVELFAAQAVRTGDAVALVAGDEHVTYRRLDRRSSRLASALRRRGVGPEVPVGLLLERSVDRVVAALGILKSGGAYVPLDPAYPEVRLAAMVAAAGIGHVVTCGALRRRLPASARLEVFTVDEAAGSFDAVPAPAPLAAAYVLFTSGSTGEPKGVVVAQGALAWYCAAAGGHYGLRGGDRLLQLASISFDISVGEIFPCLASGSTLVLAGAGIEGDCFAHCREQAITVLFPPTALWHELAALAEMAPGAVPRTLRLVSFGGERVQAGRLAAWRRAVGERIRLVNGYGPTEATVEASLADVTRAVSGDAARIGRPVAGARLYVLDRRLAPCTAGAAGELAIAGAGLARGYLGCGAATARRFVPDPFARRPGSRLYRTGDRTRWRGDGQLEILGRMDRQVKVRGFRVEPGEVEAALARHPAVRAAAVVAARGRLVAYVVADAAAGLLGVGEPRTGRQAVRGGELRRFLRHRLPSHMVPARFAFLDALPLTPNGKIDRARLEGKTSGLVHVLGHRRAASGQWAMPPKVLDSAPGGSAEAACLSAASWASARKEPIGRARPAHADLPQSAEDPERGPSPPHAGSAVEKLLRIWRQVLRFEDVGAGDDFFELGGDSILAIQIVTRAYQAGLSLTPRDVFEHPTVAALAAVAAPRAARPAVAAREPAGPSPLTPVQCWFFFDARFPEPWHFNQSMLLELRRPLSPAVLAAAVDRLLRHHDVLRSRFEGTAAHGWRQVFGARQAPSPTVGIDLSRLAAAGRHLALETAAARLQASLDLGRGPLARFGYFDLGRGRPPRLLIAVHHLVVDAVSWSILLTDLERVCRRLARGRAGGLPPKTTSYQTWAELQAEHATSAELERELEYWTAVPGGSPLPRDVPGGANTVGSAEVVSIALDAATTRRLLRSAPAAYRTRIDDLLLTALGRALGPWAGAVTVDLESHGREEEVFPGVDLSRTVGWFTSTFPVHLDLAGVDDPGEALMTVKETLRRIPRQGIGYGMLRYLSGAAVRLPTNVELSFNYLGQLDALLAGSELFAPAAEPRGAERSRRGMRSYVFEVDGGVVGGRLWIHWQFSHHLHRRETVERLAGAYRRELEELVAHCLAPGSGGVTPSDFPLAGLGRGALERLALERDVEDVYPLSPVQQGMLFHALLAPGTAVYLEQSSWALAGDLDERALRRAWQRLAARHAILRTAFVWEGLDRPLQVVRRRVELPWRLEDWRDAGVAEQEKRLKTLFRRERERGFDLGRAPLARLVLVRLGDRRHRLLWSVHHLLLDGWSIAALFDELFEIYGALRRRREPDLAPRRPLRDFIAWLERRDPAAAEAFWRRELAGFTAPTRVAGAPPGGAARGAAGPGREVAEARRRLDAGTTAALKSLAKRRRVTLATVLQGAWAWVLSRHAGSDDVVFGATVAGRPADLPGADSIIGLLINTLPVRVRPDPDQPLPPWLARLQAQSLARQAHEHTPLVDVQAWSEVPPQLPLFDSLLVFENYPAEVPLEAEQRRGGLEIGDFRGYSHTHYPLTLGVLPGVGLTLEASFDPARIETLAALRLLRQLETVLAATAAGAGRTLGDLSVLSAAERHQLRFEWSGRGAVGAAAACVHERIEAFVARTPDAAAVVSEADDRDADGGGLVVTYGELGRRASRLAGFLRALGVGPESRVGLALDRSPDIVVAILAVLSAGGAYVPLDPAHPRRRLAAMLAGSGVTLLVARGTAFAGAGVPVLDVDAVGAFGSSVAVPASVDSSPSVSRAGLAYVLHTSGSTGAPKGVMISHGALLDTLAAWEHDYRLRRVARRHLQVAAFTFDVASGDLVRALGTGATLVLSPCAALLAPRRLAELLRRQRVDAVELVPALAELLAEHLEREGERLEGLRLLAVGSEAWRMDALDRLARVAGRRARLISSYGVTEATVDSTFFDPRGSAAGAALAGERSVPIGRALAGRRLYVLDRRLAPVAAGVPGQLCLGGTGLARGYAGRPAATAERFVPDPFRAGGGAGRRLYLTGDRARHLSDGQLELSGRLDQQLKLRGVRVEPGEVEAALRRHPAVREAVVVGGEDAAGERVLAAFLVPEPGAGEIRPEAARRFLARRLPAPMVPSAFVTLRALPLSRNGKVDRAALGRNVLPRAAGGAAWEAPATPAEKRLAEIFTRVLGVGRVGRRDDFFQLGGHSLKAVRLMVEIERHFGVRLPLATLFRGPVLADLARRIAAPAAPKASRILVEIARGNGAPPFFCVHPVGGHVLCYAELARHLGVEHPVYGLQSPGAAGLRGRPLTGVGAMARRYLEAIREARPRGPYLLGGWSMGGVVAFEIARQLSRRGEEVAAVVVIDCAVPGSPSAAAVDRVPSLEAFAEDLGIDPPPPVAGLPPTEALRRILDEGIQRGVLDRQIRRRELERLYRLFAANDRAMKRYRPGRYDGRVALFRSAHWDGDPTLGWSRVARRVDVRVVGGDHATMVREPHVRGLAAMLRAQLADALCATRA